MRVGLVFDLFEDHPLGAGDPPDADAEHEPPETVAALEGALRRLDHNPVRLGTPRDLLAQMGTLDVDAVVNIAESAGSRNREAHAPVLSELAGVPCLGSDALSLSLTLDKAYTSDLARVAGVNALTYRSYRRADDVDESDLPGDFPLFVKPRREGSSMGLSPASKVGNASELRSQVEHIAATYEQDALVEPFVEGGGEFTVAVVGNDPPEALPVLQRAVEAETRIGLHALEHRGALERDWTHELGGTLAPALEDELQEQAVCVYEKLRCKDFARADFRIDDDGTPWFLEINPLPTFKPGDTFAIVAELMNREYEDFLAGVLQNGFERLGV
jgi:D-alanine-D-alanine ligase